MFYSPNGLFQSKVGVRYYPATESHPPLRLFYPCESSQNARPFAWLQERGIVYYLQGYANLATRGRYTWLLYPFIYLLSFLLPMQWRALPRVYSDAPMSDRFLNNNNNKLPVIVFSHGLTGTGQENALLLAAWASLGFLVASVHHTDGSSSRVRLYDGSDLFYQHGPPFHSYNANFRPHQIEHRAKEILQACHFVETMYPVQPGVCVAGFSYGAATAARVATLAAASKHTIAAAILLDGWFYIDVSESAGIEFPFPQSAFESSSWNHLPRIFVNSEQFANIPKLFQATRQLASSTSSSNAPSSTVSELHVISGTGHQNFCDVIFWAPQFVLRRVLGQALGPKHAVVAYQEIVHVTSDFLMRHFFKEAD